MQLRRTGARLAALALLLSTGFSTSSCSESEKPAAPPSPPAPAALTPAAQQDRDSLYAIGAWLARNLAGIKIEEKDLAPLEEGLSDALLGRKLRVDPVVVGERVQGFLNARRAQTSAEEKAAGAPFLEAAQQEPGVQRTTSGALYLSLVEGTGATPTLTDRVKLHFRGTLRDGTTFNDSRQPGPKNSGGGAGVFRVTAVIPCWMESLQKMKVGGKAKVTCNSDLAYGDRGLPGKVLPGAPLQFELELLEILPPEAAAASPAEKAPAKP